MLTRITIVFLFLLISTHSFSQVKNQRADDLFDAYNTAFLSTDANGRQFYREALNVNTADYFWRQGLDMLMAEDVYYRTKSSAHKDIVHNLLSTFLYQTQYDWNGNTFNDDLLWVGLALARGYKITGDQVFLDKAKYVFSTVYNRSWDTTLGGGIWWNTGKQDKSALSNSTAIMLGCYLYEYTGDSYYLTTSSAIYNWVSTALYDPTTGECYENMTPNGSKTPASNVYILGLFISASNHLHRLTGNESLFYDAKRAVDYCIKYKTIDGTKNSAIRPSSERQGTNVSEFMRGLGEFVRDNNLWKEYYSWMKLNADAAWNARRTDKNLIWNNWTQQTPSDNITTAIECVGALVTINVTPPAMPVDFSKTTNRIIPKINGNSAFGIIGAGSTSGSNTEISTWVTGTHQLFKIDSLGAGYYRITPQNATGTSVNANGANDGADIQISNTTNGTLSQEWKVVYDYDNYYKFKPRHAPTKCINIIGATPTDGTKCLLWPEGYQDNERWNFHPSSTTGIITAYSELNYTGYSAGFGIGDYTLADLQARGLLDDEMSSISIPEGYQVYLYINDNFDASGGVSSALTGNVNFISGWDNAISSIRIRAKGISGLNGSYNIINNGTGLAMDISGSSTANGAMVVTNTSTSSSAQVFTLVEIDNGSYTITNKNSGKLLDVTGISQDQGALIQQLGSDGGLNQYFIAVDAGGGLVKLIAAHSAKVLDVSSASGTQLYQWWNAGQSNSYWKLQIPTVTSVEGEILSNDLSIQPNPAHDYITIEGTTDDATIGITDITGKELKSISHYDGSKLDISQLGVGVYVLRITSNTSNTATKFVKY